MNVASSPDTTINHHIRYAEFRSSLPFLFISIYDVTLLNARSGSMDLTDTRNISMELSSDESAQMGGSHAAAVSVHLPPASKHKKLKNSPGSKYRGCPAPNTLLIQPFVHLGQSLPNLNFSLNAAQPSGNTLLVPGTSSGHTHLLSPSHRGISYPPPSPTR